MKSADYTDSVDRIQCSEEGNPKPSYQWKNMTTGDMIQDVFDVSEDMVNRSYEFQCTASNQYNIVSSTLIVGSDGRCNDSCTISAQSVQC